MDPITSTGCHIPLERLCARQQASKDDGEGNRVFAAVLSACIAERFCPDTQLRVSVESTNPNES